LLVFAQVLVSLLLLLLLPLMQSLVLVLMSILVHAWMMHGRCSHALQQLILLMAEGATARDRCIKYSYEPG
jgi:hypothetical protein